VQRRRLRVQLVLALREEALVAKPFVDGKYTLARFVQAHAGRMGGPLTPKAAVVHTTDMLPNDFAGLVRQWSESDGSYACANFIIGRDTTQGLVQMVPVNRNSNHAGGKVHGWWETADGSLIHPNLVAVGIEVHNAGRLSWLSSDRAVYQENGRTLGEFRVGAGEVFVDNLGRPWHKVTDYQKDTLARLLRDLHELFLPLQAHVKPDAALVKDRSKWDMSYAEPACQTLVGHASLDPINKMDPGPELMAFINDFAKKENWA
jgi:N-acetyl-anhydromuramyl-L-alanine amidase AmpD